MNRTCMNCGTEMPPETEHYVIEDEPYCTDCVEVTPFTAYMYYLDGEFVGTSENEQVKYVESYEDEYEYEEEETA